MARADRARADRGDRGSARGSVPTPLPLGVPLIAVMLLSLLVDRVLGIVSFAVAPQDGFTGGLRPADPAALLADLVAVGVVVGALVIVELSGRPRTRGAMLGSLFVAALVGLQIGAAAAGSVTGERFTTDFYLARALLLAGTTIAALLVLAALAEHRHAAGALRSATASAESLAASGRAALGELREDVARRVREVLREVLAALEVDGSAGSGARLRSLADDVLRPLSHRLASMPAPAAPVTAVVVTPRWRETFRTLTRAPVVPARSLALLATGLAFLRTLVTDQDAVRDLAPAIPEDAEGSGVALTVDVLPLLISFADLLFVLAVTWWGAGRLARLLKARRPTLRPAVAWLLVSLGLVGVALLTVAGPAVAIDRVLAAGSPVVGVPAGLVATFVPLLVVTLGVSLVAAAAEGRAVLEARLDDQRAETARTAARVQAVLGHEQRRLARSLHADVQATVNAAGLMLDRADREGAVTPDLLDDVSERIAVAVERLVAGSTSPLPFVERVAEVRTLWAGVSSVEMELDEQVAERLDADAVTRELIVDLVTEACANAVVHGDAGEITVRVSVSLSGDEVVLEVADDGARSRSARTTSGPASEPDAASAGGLGTEVLRASCTSFTLDVGEHGARLTAMVPLG
jgi:signal transduction histidine kinase